MNNINTNKYSSWGGGHFTKVKGFTLIELLAVIIILGILMIIAIPAVTEYISSSRKSAYITTASRYIDGVRNKINAAEIPVYDKEATYYIPGSCVSMEKGGYSPYGDWKEYYVVVTYDGTGYDYYWTSRDETNTGIYLTYQDLLDVDRIENNVTSISTNIGVGDREKIIVLKDSCDINDIEEKLATVNIEEKGYVDGSLSMDMIGMHQESILNGAYPRLKNNLIPITIENDGTVKKADTSTKWYSYEEKRWANAVILKDESEVYNNGEIIPEDAIESYFVWIPRYRYKLWNVDNVSSSGVDESVVHEIEIEFESKSISPSNGSSNGEWLTHPAFTSFDVNGMWVGKFETGYDGATSVGGANKNTTEADKVIIKPNVYSWRNIQVANAFTVSYNYKRELESHMMKNTEWGAVAYLSHSIYGINGEIRINNNSQYKTGYAATTENGSGSTTNVAMWNTPTGYLASTTGNITGVYDMSGGVSEYVMGVVKDANGNLMSGYSQSSNSGFNGTLKDGSSYTDGIDFPDSKYYDVYNYNSNTSYYNYLGDATGELGPFQKGQYQSRSSSWYDDYAYFVYYAAPWFVRGGSSGSGSWAGAFFFNASLGSAKSSFSFRLVLCL